MATASENVLQIKLQTTGATAASAEFARMGAALKTFQAQTAQMQDGFRRLAAGLVAIGTATAKIGLVGLTAATTTATVALVKGTKAAIEMGDSLADLSAQTSVNVSSLAVLQQAFTLAGVGADRVGDAVSKMLKTLADASDSQPLLDRFEQLNLDLAKLRALDPAAQFQAIGNALAALRDPAEQTAAAVSIFGKSGAELLPLFKDGGQAIATAKIQLGGLPAILERNAAALSALADAGDGFKLKLTQLGGGFLDALLPALDGLADRLNRIDLSGIGRQVGVWTATLIDAVKDERLGEFLALNLGAGFELFMGMVRQNFIGPSFWTGLGNVLVTSAYKFLGVLAEAGALVATPLLAAVDYVATGLKQGFLAAANVLGEAMTDALNTYVDAFNTLFGTAFARFTYTARETGAANFAESWSRAADMVKGRLDAVTASFQATIEGYRADVGATGGMGSDLDTLRQRLALKDAELRQQAEWTDEASRSVDAYNRAVDALEAQRVAAARLDADLADMAADSEAWVASLDRAKVLSDAIARDTMIRSIYAGRVGQDFADFGVQQQAEKATGFGGAGPGAIAGLQQALMDFGTVAQQVGEAIRHSIGGAIDAVSTGITSAILRTKTWGQAFLDVGRAILDNVVNAIIHMAVTWVAQRVIMATAGRAIAAATAASLAPIAAAQSALWATPATLATISSYGGAAAAAPGQIALAQGATFAQALAGFAGGGYTGDLSADAIAGAVHGREFVFNAPMTASLGREDLEALHRGEATIQRPGPSASSTSFNVAVMNSRAEANAWLKTGEGRGIVLDLLAQNRHEFQRG